MVRESQMTAEEKIERAKIEITSDSPFFRYIVLESQFEPVEDLGVLARVGPYGHAEYDPDMVDELSVDEVKGLVTHEVLHLALEHPWRDNPDWFEADILESVEEMIVNGLIGVESGYDLPETEFQPYDGDSFKFENEGMDDIVVEDTTSKDLFEIYREFADQLPDDPDEDDDGGELEMPDDSGDTDGDGQGGGSEAEGEDSDQGGNSDDNEDDQEEGSGGNGEGEKDDKETGEEGDEGEGETERKTEPEAGFDVHEHGGGEKDGEKTEEQEKWEKALSKSVQCAISAGNAPAGVQDKLEELMGNDVPWGDELQHFVQKQIPSGFTYQSPSPVSRVAGVYMPDIEYGESIDIIISVDTSGSMSTKTLSHVKADMFDISQTYESVNLQIISHDTEVQDVTEVKEGRLDKLEGWHASGRGGTDIRAPFKHIRDKYIDCDVFIEVTDGRGPMPETPPRYSVAWVLAGNHIPAGRVPFGRVIEVDS